MTPKEKAEELVNKYSIWCWNEVVCDYEIAKQCALIAIDEIIKSNPIFVTSKLEGKDGMHEAYLYYQEVKQEIEKR
jgi:hypothetical protein